MLKNKNNRLCKILGHSWESTKYMAQFDGIRCIICEKHIQRCKRCRALKCDCGVIE